jgi:hypothetical protein
MVKKKYKKCNGYPLKKAIGHTEYMRAFRSPDPGRTLKRMGILDEKALKKMSRALLFAWLMVFSWFILTPSYVVRVLTHS